MLRKTKEVRARRIEPVFCFLNLNQLVSRQSILQMPYNLKN